MGVQLESVALPSQATMMPASNPSATQLGLEGGWVFDGVGLNGTSTLWPSQHFSSRTSIRLLPFWFVQIFTRSLSLHVTYIWLETC